MRGIKTSKAGTSKGKKGAAIACPICGKPADAVLRPFCSKRCADIDLGRWLKEGYRVPTGEGPSEDESGDEGRGPTGQES
jgi:endogenous inhibitor of DNA gyrase (YacG/DUF329 family)